MMLHLKNSEGLDLIKRLIIDKMVNIKDDHDVFFGKNVDEIVLNVCEGLDIPIINNFPCGHGDYQTIFPVSHLVELNANHKKPHIIISESPVI
ncbi:MAG: muramoyltetrapeptide carboxypeptidase LdcA involved in peptidoglycan recycling [Polaribacter sp.]|jgi:muramoyltetrapeptide carboxypeptidase LdcA involved in peptidoglycan recycling